MSTTFFYNPDLLKRIQYVVMLIVACLLPIGQKLIPIAIVILALSWLVEGDFRRKFRSLKQSKTSWLFISFYLVHLLGMLYTKNLDFGWFDLEIKLSLLVFPFLFATSDRLSTKHYRGILTAFIIGGTASLMVNFGISFLAYQTTKNVEEFFYLNFSTFNHPGYISMYYVLGIAILVYRIIEDENNMAKGILALRLIVAAMLAIGVFLLSAKSGLISFFLLLIWTICYLTFIKKVIVKGIIVVLAVTLAGYIAFNFSTLVEERIRGAWAVIQQDRGDLLPTSVESTTVRLIIWPEALQVFEDNLFLGVGTGDVKDELLKRYEVKGYTGIIERKSNAHNQYLQTMVALGLLGITSLILCLLIPIFISMKRRNYLYLFFLIIIIQSAFTESILEVQAGVVFYAFFNSFFMFLNPVNIRENIP